ncbi:hypothetical protein N0V95_004777 [Ascochyta clinopodiicola]|nr:hypothetical protein N0V95_004777 [Ascochyta clinopodiicola]
MSTENLIRITVLANRNPNISEEDAHKKLTSQTTLSYDGMADFYVRKYEDFEKAYEDPYYKDVVKPDEEYLFDVENMRVMVGTETCVIEDAEIVKGRGRKD